MYIFALNRTLLFDVTSIIWNINWKAATGPEKLRATLQYVRPDIQQTSILNIVYFSYSRISGIFSIMSSRFAKYAVFFVFKVYFSPILTAMFNFSFAEPECGSQQIY